MTTSVLWTIFDGNLAEEGPSPALAAGDTGRDLADRLGNRCPVKIRGGVVCVFFLPGLQEDGKYLQGFVFVVSETHTVPPRTP
jgi:hypothetical protein